MIQIDNYLLANIRNVYQTRKSYRYSLLLHVIKDFLLISVLHIANKKKKIIKYGFEKNRIFQSTSKTHITTCHKSV